MKWYYRLLIFLVLNFAALGIGSLFTNDGVSSIWYQNLNKAPWTPPGWVFGAAWTTIMIFFSLYMMFVSTAIKKIEYVITLYSIQWILNVVWNPVFFRFHDPVVALIIISLLTCVVGFFLFAFWSSMKSKSLLITPYLFWLLIAFSLNAYIVSENPTDRSYPHSYFNESTGFVRAVFME